MNELGISSQLNGCGKLKYDLVLKLTKKNLPGPNGTISTGASKFEILTLIYLSQIADKSGYISQFTTKDLATVIGCHERSVYVIIKGLQSKGFIKAKYYEDLNWSGVKDITILNNDFSKVKKYNKTTRYVSTFYPCFDFTNESSQKFLEGLSLYALRTLLYILTIYNYDNGCRISCNKIKDALQIQDRSLIIDYMEELSTYFGTDFYKLGRAANRRYIYGNLTIHSRNPFLIPTASPADEQLTYYKRKWMLYILNNDIFVCQDCSLLELLNLIFSTVYHWLTKGVSLELIEHTLISKFESDKSLTQLDIGLANNELSLLAVN